MPARIVSIATAAPEVSLGQSEIYARFYRDAFGRSEGAEALFCNVGVRRRHGVFVPGSPEVLEQLSTAQRMQIWKTGSMALGRRCLAEAFEHASRERIGSFVMASCTGYDTPSPDALLAAEFGLPRDLRRSFIGHMGCHAAFAATKLALDALAARPQQDVLVHCTEICSVHMRVSENSREQIVSQALFGDASAAVVLSADASRNGPQLLHTHTEGVPEHVDQLGWRIGDDGFRMTLSSRLPVSIGRALPGFVDRLLAPLQLRVSDVRHWGIHPGGPMIVEMAARVLALRPSQIDTSLGVLPDHGNCSSATILLILQRLLQRERPEPGSLGVLLGFGPGLTIEGLVLRF